MIERTDEFEKLDFSELSEAEMQSRARSFLERMSTRRTVRSFSDRPVPKEIIKQALATAGSAPSGANRQPWHFAVAGTNEVKRRIRIGAEEEEYEFYNRRAPKEWLDALAPFGTDEKKPFLEIAPWVITVFAKKIELDVNKKKQKNYNITESVCIANGLLVAALHNAGLATLTHTPSPMKFLNQIFDRPVSEKPLMLVVVGYPGEKVMVPSIKRKTLEEISSFH